MKRELKRLLSKHEIISNEWYNMYIDNSTEEERKEKWNELIRCREEITDICISILGVKTEEQAKAISASLSRGTLYKCLKGS